MKKKIIGILVMMLFITTTVLPASSIKIIESNNNLKDTQIDQVQEQYDDDVGLYIGQHKAQSFIPQYPRFVRVELYLYTPHDGSAITLHLREALDGPDLTYWIVPASDGPEDKWSWVEFNMMTVEVITGETYYLVVTSDDDDDVQIVRWGYSSQNPYLDGEAWEWSGYYQQWGEMVECDFCFRTFGSKARSKNLMEVENNFNFPFFQKIIENHPNMFPLLQRLLQRLGLQ